MPRRTPPSLTPQVGYRPGFCTLRIPVLAVAGIVLAATSEVTAQSWHLLASAQAPSGRYGSGMCFDESHGQTLLFGGGCLGGEASDTWSHDGSAWTQLHPIHAPSGRSTTMVYDSVRARCVVFGGWTGSTRMNDVWEWDGADWTQPLPTSPVPPGRDSHRATFDRHRGRMVVFGGWNGSQCFSDTWEWNGSAWFQGISTAHPSPRWGVGLAYDEVRAQTVLFGGGNISPSIVYNDTWTWDGTTWTQVAPVSSPSPREAATMTFDAALSRVILHAGTTAAGSSYLDDAWTWDGQTWSQLQPNPPAPANRWWAAATFDRAHQQTIVFGGITAPGSANPANWLSDTWALGGAPASTSTFGPGCPGSNGVPTLIPQNAPAIGTTFLLSAVNLPTPATSLAVGFFGFSRTSWGFNLLPYNLAPQGMPGCFLLVAPPPPGVILSAFTANGACTWSQDVPNAPWLVGVELFFQALIPDDHAGNPLMATVTNGLRAVIGW